MTRRCEESVPLIGPWLDGELERSDQAWLEEHVSTCAGCQVRRDLFIAQGAALREQVVARAEGVDFSGLADRVMAKVKAERRPALVLRAELWGAEMWGAHRAIMSGAGALALAACLALAVFFRPATALDEVPRGDLVASAQQPSATVDEVDFDGVNGAVLQTQGAAGQAPTTVIWVEGAK